MLVLFDTFPDDPAIARITLNRPDQRNAFNTAMADALRDALDRFEADPALRVAVLCGAGKVFCAGMDLAAFAAGERPGIDGPHGFGHFVRRPRSKPVIAAVNGAAIAGGLEIMLACDMAVAATDARFAMPEVKRGIIAAGGGAIRLAAQLPPVVAREILLTGDMFDANRAHALGLLNTLTAPGEAEAAALDLARRIVPNAPLAVAQTRALIDSVAQQGEGVGWAASAAAWAVVQSSADALEGARAFKEKREPRWSGA